MKIIKPSATVMEHNVTPYEFIEKVGRTCYKSEDHITIGSAERFVAGLVKREHMAMLEHEHIYLVMSDDFMHEFLWDMFMVREPLKFFNFTHEKGANILSGSFRSFYDLLKKDYRTYTLEFIKRGLKLAYPLVFGSFIDASFFKNYPVGSCVLTSREEFIDTFKNRGDILFKHLVHTFLFVCDRGVSHEFVRHRPASFAQESTRYCNYSKDKFGKEITVIEPCFWKGKNSAYPYEEWKEQCESAEKSYFRLLEMGATPQEARIVLPTSLKTEIIITATEKEWQHIVNLRYLGTTGAPHPQIKEVVGLTLDYLTDNTRVNVSLKKG